jgi:hypothetical protein
LSIRERDRNHLRHTPLLRHTPTTEKPGNIEEKTRSGDALTRDKVAV